LAGTSGNENDFILSYGQRNIECVYLENTLANSLLKYYSIHLACIILALVSNLFKGEGDISVFSKMDVFGQIGSTLRKRKNVQKRRKASLRYLEQFFDNRSLIRRRTKGD